MTTAERIQYHRTRADQERALARAAACAVAASAHLALARLHEERLAALQAESAPPRPKLHAAFARGR